jgi:hypothetical protein
MLRFAHGQGAREALVMQDPVDLHVDLHQDPELVVHERTYEAFNALLRWSMVALGSGILFLTLWFASTAGFLGALAVGVIAFALGYFFLIRQEAHQPLDVSAPDR